MCLDSSGDFLIDGGLDCYRDMTHFRGDLSDVLHDRKNVLEKGLELSRGIYSLLLLGGWWRRNRLCMNRSDEKFRWGYNRIRNAWARLQKEAVQVRSCRCINTLSFGAPLLPDCQRRNRQCEDFVRHCQIA